MKKNLTEEELRLYLPDIKFIALKVISRLPSWAMLTADDLVGAGVIGLIDAMEKFDPSFNKSFISYAKIRIRGAMLDEIRSLDWIPRSLRQRKADLEKSIYVLERRLNCAPKDNEIAEELGISLEDYYEMANSIQSIGLLPEEINGSLLSKEEMAEQTVFKREVRDIVQEAMESLPSREQSIVEMSYYEGKTMKDIGGVLGYTESRISQLHTKAMIKLRNWFERSGSVLINDYL